MVAVPVLAAGALVLASCGTGGSAGTPTMVASVADPSPAPSTVAATPPAAPSRSLAVTTLTVTSTVAAGPTEPAPSTIPATDLTGEVYGFVTAVDPTAQQLTLDKIDWFSGDAARQACAEDGVTSTDNNRCTGWYYRNNNPALRVVAVAPDATISVLNGGVRPVPGDLAAVAAEITNVQSPWRLQVTDGRVTALEEIYLP